MISGRTPQGAATVILPVVLILGTLSARPAATQPADVANVTDALRRCTDTLRDTDRNLTDLRQRAEARLRATASRCPAQLPSTAAVPPVTSPDARNELDAAKAEATQARDDARAARDRLAAAEQDLVQIRAEREETRRTLRDQIENSRAAANSLNRSRRFERSLFAAVGPLILADVWADRQKSGCETLTLTIDDAGKVVANGEVRDAPAIRDRLGAALRARQIGMVDVATDGLKSIEGCVKYLGSDKRFAIDQEGGRYRATYLPPLLEKEGRPAVGKDGRPVREPNGNPVMLAPSFLPTTSQCETIGRLLEADRDATDVTVFFVREANDDVGLCAKTGDSWKAAGNRAGTQAYVVRQMGGAR